MNREIKFRGKDRENWHYRLNEIYDNPELLGGE